MKVTMPFFSTFSNDVKLMFFSLFLTPFSCEDSTVYWTCGNLSVKTINSFPLSKLTVVKRFISADHS